MKIKIHQQKIEKCSDSFFYDGHIATISEGKKVVEVYAAGDIRIQNKAGEIVHDGWNERGDGITLETDEDLKKVGSNYDDDYYWENNNWFECFFAFEGDSLDCLLGDVRDEYDDAIQFAKDILESKDYEHLWEGVTK